jgi:hypothetical protein
MAQYGIGVLVHVSLLVRCYNTIGVSPNLELDGVTLGLTGNSRYLRRLKDDEESPSDARYLYSCSSPVLAGKNAGGALVVHTDDSHDFYSIHCSQFDSLVPQDCEQLNTRTDGDHYGYSFIWFIAAFDSSSSPGVTSVVFGNDHNLPEYYHIAWAFCGPAGTIEIPDSGWPEDPANAGTDLRFGSPILDDHFFPIYRVLVAGFEGAYCGTGLHPTFGYAFFRDDSDPQQIDEIERFGQVRWYVPGYNVCPGYPPEESEACCFPVGTCFYVTPTHCALLGGVSQGPGTECDPNPCPNIGTGACCLESHECVFVLPLQCQDLAGFFVGEEIECEPDPCFGACCFDNGECGMRQAVHCVQLGGEYMGPGSDCYSNPCVNSNVPEMLIQESTWGRIKTGYRR